MTEYQIEYRGLDGRSHTHVHRGDKVSVVSEITYIEATSGQTLSVLEMQSGTLIYEAGAFLQQETNG